MKNKYIHKILNIYHYSDKFMLGFSCSDNPHNLGKIYNTIPDLIYCSNFSSKEYRVCLNHETLSFKHNNLGFFVNFTIPSYAIYKQLQICLRDWDIFL